MWALAKPFLPHILIALGVIGGVWWFSHSRYTAGYEARSAEVKAQVAEANERTRVAEIESRKRVEAVDREYQIKLQDLDARYRDASSRLGSIRVRQCPSGGIALSRDPEPAAIDHGATGADGLSRDVSGDIERRILKPADKQAERLIACQAFVRSLYPDLPPASAAVQHSE